MNKIFSLSENNTLFKQLVSITDIKFNTSFPYHVRWKFSSLRLLTSKNVELELILNTSTAVFDKECRLLVKVHFPIIVHGLGHYLEKKKKKRIKKYES